MNPGGLKPPPDRLYGRQRGHKLRARQQRLLQATLPRLRFDPAQAADPLEAFPTCTELWLEVGFGSGEHAEAMSAAHPDAALIACEVFETGLCSLLSRLVPEGAEDTAPVPANLRLWPDDARTLLRSLPPASLSRLFLLFPDPWPKARHAKRRFVHPEVLRDAARALRPGGTWRIATDDPTYQAWVMHVVADQPWFAVPDAAALRPPGWPGTRYEAKALSAGRHPRYWELTRLEG